MKAIALLCVAAAAVAVLSAPAPHSVSLGRYPAMGMTNTHRHAKNAKLISLGKQAQPNEQIGGDIYPVAVYWVFAEIGTPSKPYPVALDSGSMTLDIPTAGCQGCPTGAPNQGYDVNDSSTGSAASPDGQSTFSNTYQTCDLSDPAAPCTISGNFYQDQVSLAGLPAITAVFGGITYQTTNFDQFKYVCGVVGLIPTGGNQDVFGSIVAAGSVANNEYAMCFIHGSKSNGTITFGGVDSRLYTGAISWVPNAPAGFSGYNLAVNDFLIGGTSAGSEFQGSVAILDSGTNVLLLTDEQFSAVKQVFVDLCDTTPLVGVCSGLVKNGTTLFDGTCYDMTDADIDAFPDLTFNLQGATLTMDPRDYLLHRFDSVEKCLGIIATGSEEDGGLFIVGDTLMENYYTIFDNTNNRIGWADVNAANCGSI